MNHRPEPAADLALPQLSWTQVRDELTPAATRLAELLAAVPHTSNSAVGSWSVAETAAHLSHVWTAIPLLARRDLAGATRAMPASEGLGTPSGAVFGSIDALAPWTKRAVDSEPERDLARLSRTIQDCATSFQAHDHESDESPRPWIFDGVLGAPVLFGCHVLNETYVHGDDIARAAGGQPWTVDPRAAALIVRCFLFEVLCQATNAGPPRKPWFSIDLRMTGHERFFLINDAAGMRLERPSGRRVDAHLRADPASLLLYVWQRRSLPALIARGRLLVWGPRPWKARAIMAFKPDV